MLTFDEATNKNKAARKWVDWACLLGYLFLEISQLIVINNSTNIIRIHILNYCYFLKEDKWSFKLESYYE